MSQSKRLLIWAGNLEREFKARAKEHLKLNYPDCFIGVRNIEAYHGPDYIEECIGVVVQPGYDKVSADHLETGIPVLIIPTIETSTGEFDGEGPSDQCGEGNEASADDGQDNQSAGIQAPDLVSLPPAEPYQVGDRLANDHHVPGTRRRNKPGRKAQGRAEK